VPVHLIWFGDPPRRPPSQLNALTVIPVLLFCRREIARKFGSSADLGRFLSGADGVAQLLRKRLQEPPSAPAVQKSIWRKAAWVT
jgi:hypothetical protein